MSPTQSNARRRLLRTFATAAAFPFAHACFPGVARAQETARNALSEGAPSATAASAALHRAVHQVIDYPRVLDDALALRILEDTHRSRLQASVDNQSRGMRAFIAMRSRYTEDRLAVAVARGVRQYVVLGAGLDTLAYRNSHASAGLRVFEVDHPATQRWKRARLHAAGIALPPSLTFAPVDFESQRLDQQLRQVGFRFDQPALFSMLGVVIYLTEPAVMETLRVVASGAPGTEIVFDFALPASELTETALASREAALARMAAIGEPWLTFFHPAALQEAMRAAGFGSIDILSPAAANRAYFAQRADRLRTGGGHMAYARV